MHCEPIQGRLASSAGQPQNVNQPKRSRWVCAWIIRNRLHIRVDGGDVGTEAATHSQARICHLKM